VRIFIVTDRTGAVRWVGKALSGGSALDQFGRTQGFDGYCDYLSQFPLHRWNVEMLVACQESKP
jgi:hypothetical protein